MRIQLLVPCALLVVAALGGASAQTGWTGAVEPPPVPGTGDLDWMAFMPRNWTLEDLPDAHRVDALGVPADDDWPEIAYRIHGSIAGAEGVLVVPRGASGGLDARYNTGYRFHAITFEPPLALADGGTLHRVFPAPLAWSNLTGTDDAPTDNRTIQVLRSTAEAPRPDANGTTPPATPDADAETIVTLGMAWTFRTDPAPSDAYLVASPANLGIRIHTTVAEQHLADPDALLATNITFTFHFDFGARTQGWGAADVSGLDAGGIYLNRTGTYATLRFADNVTTDNGSTPATFRFSAPADQPVPKPEPDRLATPVSLNVTTRLPPAPGCPPDADCAPRPGRMLTLDGELGFLAPTSARPPSPSPTPTQDPDGNDAPAGALPAMLAAVAILVLARRRASHK